MNTSKINWYDIILFKRGRHLLILIFLCLIGSSILGGITPRLLKSLGEDYSNQTLFFARCWDLFYLFMAVYLNRIIFQLSLNHYLRDLMQKFRSMSYQKWLSSYDIQTSKEAKTDRYPQGEVLARIMNDTESIRELMTSGAFAIFIDLFFVGTCLLGYISLNSRSGWVIALAEIFAAILLIWGSKYMRSIFLSVRTSRGNVYKVVANTVGGLADSYYTRDESYASKKCGLAFEDFLKKMLTSNVWDASYYSVAESLYPIFLGMLIFIFPYSQITEAAIILAIVDLIQRSINPIKGIAGKIANLQRALTGVQRIKTFIDDLGSVFSSDTVYEKSDFHFKKLDVEIPLFTYPKREGGEANFSLEDISLSGAKGDLIGIVGLSGSGKSTLLSILAANILPDDLEIKILCETDKEIYFSGKSVEEIISYRDHVGIVSQDSHIFSNSLAFNISMKHEIDDNLTKFWSWIVGEIPYLKTWGLSLEDELDQKLLSLGQKQLLAAIRACFLKKPIILFDEISSALDSELEKALRRVVLVVQQYSLTIIVAHRLETIISADQILVMDKGRIISSGKHDALLEESDIYQKFIKEITH